jgi:predicted dehydrogenase
VSSLRVAIIGCGRMGVKRADALVPDDALIACYDVDKRAADNLAERYGATACATVEELLATAPQVVVVATSHDRLAEFAEQALVAGAHVLGEPETRVGPWAMLHVSWTEWKNLFSLEVFCRRAKLQVDGLSGSYGPRRLRIHRMTPRLDPLEIEEVEYPHEDRSWRREREHFTEAIELQDEHLLLGTLADARYAWSQVESAYAMGPYAEMRAPLAASLYAGDRS